MDYLSPPANNEGWWEGDFSSYFDFDALFNDIVESVPKTMADKSFEDTKWIIESSNNNEPANWNESNLSFFSEFFINYLESEGKVEHFHGARIL